MHASASIDIASTPARIFEFLKSPEKAMLWQTSVTDVQIDTATSDLVGTTGRETVSDAKGSLEMRATVVRAEVDRLIAFHVESRVNSVDVEYSLAPEAANVRLTQHAEIKWKFPMNLVMLFLGRKTLDGVLRQMSEELNKLKQLVEAGPETASPIQRG